MQWWMYVYWWLVEKFVLFEQGTNEFSSLTHGKHFNASKYSIAILLIEVSSIRMLLTF